MKTLAIARQFSTSSGGSNVKVAGYGALIDCIGPPRWSGEPYCRSAAGARLAAPAVRSVLVAQTRDPVGGRRVARVEVRELDLAARERIDDVRGRVRGV